MNIRHIPYNFNDFSKDDEELYKFLNDMLYWVTCINNINIYKEAFTHSSLEKVNNVCNERLEFLGDSILSAVLTEYLYNKYPQANEGVLTKYRTKLVNGATLAEISKKIGIDKLLAVSKRITVYNKRMLEDAFEAFIGALFIDQGVEACKLFIMSIIKLIDTGDINQDTNYKDILLKHVQSQHLGDLEYQIIDEIGPPHRKLYRMRVIICKKYFGIGCASSKKQAEQHAARETLVILGNNMENNIC